MLNVIYVKYIIDDIYIIFHSKNLFTRPIPKLL